jgi:two-component system, LuxR family, response regulator FixJ
MNRQPTVFLVEEEATLRGALCEFLNAVDQPVEAFASAREFLSAYDPARPGCLLLDVHLSDMSGLALQCYLAAKGIAASIVFITAQGDVPTAVWATQRGAVDFIEKPFSDQVLLGSIRRALQRDAQIRQEAALQAGPTSRLGQLTRREREVLDLIVAGHTTKKIAATLHLSAKTVEAHRGKIMAKMRAQGLADLVRQVLMAQANSAHPPGP